MVASRESSDSRSHASLLTVFIGDLLKEKNLKASDLEAVVVSKGPGSYTGLRIGVSAAKGISYGASVPLIGIETTFSMFCGIRNYYDGHDDSALFCPVLDARRMEVYYAIYDYEGNIVKKISAEVITETTFSDFRTKTLFLFGDGAIKLKPVLKEQNISFIESFRMSAAHLARPACDALTKSRFENLAYFEPLYLKDFIATSPKKNILGI